MYSTSYGSYYYTATCSVFTIQGIQFTVATLVDSIKSKTTFYWAALDLSPLAILCSGGQTVWCARPFWAALLVWCMVKTSMCDGHTQDPFLRKNKVNVYLSNPQCCSMLIINKVLLNINENTIIETNKK